VGWWDVSRQPTMRLKGCSAGPDGWAYDRGIGTIQAPNYQGSVWLINLPDKR
jgi:hypothetical protein